MKRESWFAMIAALALATAGAGWAAWKAPDLVGASEAPPEIAPRAFRLPQPPAYYSNRVDPDALDRFAAANVFSTRRLDVETEDAPVLEVVRRPVDAPADPAETPPEAEEPEGPVDDLSAPPPVQATPPRPAVDTAPPAVIGQAAPGPMAPRLAPAPTLQDRAPMIDRTMIQRAPAVSAPQIVTRTPPPANRTTPRVMSLRGVFPATGGPEAVILTSTGAVVKVRVGQVVEGWRVTQIATKSVRLQQNGRAITLSLPHP